MKIRIYSIYDLAARAWLQPFFSPTDETAARAFRHACNDPDIMFSQHSPDYTLFFVGEFDDEKGVLTGSTPAALGNGLQYKDAAE